MKARTILIVDDQKVNRNILRRLLNKEYNIIEAENGQQALDILRKNAAAVSAVLLDIVMPIMDGYDVLRAMRDDEELSKIPVLVSSQRDGDEAEIKALNLGALDFIAKPYKADIISRRLENTIRLRETAAMVNRAEKDELTGLLNKQFFAERVADTLRQNPDKKFDLLCFDVMRFKLVNDAYGTETGDKLLRHIAALLDESPVALLSARFSADNFYQMVPRAAEDPSEFFRDFLNKVREFPIEMKIDISCGIYQIGDITASVSGMCDRAKLAADSNRRRSDVPFSLYDDSIRKRLLEEQFIIDAMKAGLEQHQFVVYYQPKYDLRTEKISGAEALVRWIHPEKGFMSPGEFIPIFEKNGFITQLDHYVWEETCKSIRKWIDDGIDPKPISVNVSRADIFNPKLPDILLGLTERYSIPLESLHLEITESAYTDNQEQIIAVVGQLHDMGFVIEMDDFGSGYSSLNMLAELPVDILKLDMRFVQTETSNTSGRGIMSFVISLAKWMKLSVIAEGVETAEQIETLRSMDCNFVQGYYYAKPMPKEDFERILKVAEETHINTSTAPQTPTLEQTEHKDRIMLIVDDIEINRGVLVSLFIDEYNIVEKENGKQALEYLQNNYEKVDVIMLDLIMPVMDGFQMLTRIKENENLRDIPVIVTSQWDTNAEAKALDMGANDFISKPYNTHIVKHRVHNAVQLNRLKNTAQS